MKEVKKKENLPALKLTMSSYCARCKKKTPNQAEHLETSKTGRHLLKSTCGVCGAKKSSFAPGSSSKEGDGLFGWIPGGVGNTLDNLANGAISVGERVAVPVATNLLRSKMGGAVRTRRLQ
jgi:hypothetical protein